MGNSFVAAMCRGRLNFRFKEWPRADLHDPLMRFINSKRTCIHKTDDREENLFLKISSSAMDITKRNKWPCHLPDLKIQSVMEAFKGWRLRGERSRPPKNSTA
ncbi:hypothetical protein [Pseudomonas cichorii]|uniref:hypothetical protein n=1 Tax=Pseudomonas cichorii TaxID=36746 RepID=UPI00191090C5|nr:hypothetical protein [Pseudomonas cichorii]